MEASPHIGGNERERECLGVEKNAFIHLFIYLFILVRFAGCCIFCPLTLPNPAAGSDWWKTTVPAQPGFFAQAVVLHEQVGVAAPN